MSQPATTEPFSNAIDRVMRNAWLAVPLLFLASTLVLSLVYLQTTYSTKWLSGTDPMVFSGSALTLNKGQGYPGRDKLVIEGSDGDETAIATLSFAGFQAEDFAFVQWNIGGATPGVEMEFLWRTAGNRTFKRTLSRTEGDIKFSRMTDDKNWRGRIIGLALVVKGKLAAPLTIKSVSLLPARAALPIILKRWITPDRWEGASINVLDVNVAEQDAAPLPAIATIVLLAWALYWGVAKYKVAPMNPAVVLGVIFIGWLALDARWQVSLFKQLDLTRQQYAGKSWEEKHLAADDGPLFDFMRQARTKLPAGASRIRYFSDDNFLRGRGAYHLYPHNVYMATDLTGAAQFRPGEIIVLYAKKNVRIDLTRQLLAWDNQSLPVELLLLAGNNAVLRVR